MGKGPGARTGPCLTGAVAAGPVGEAQARLPPQQAPGQAAPQGAHGGAGGSDLAAAGLGRPAEALRARPSPGMGQVSVPPLKAAAGTGRPPRLHGASRYRASPARSIPPVRSVPGTKQYGASPARSILGMEQPSPLEHPPARSPSFCGAEPQWEQSLHHPTGDPGTCGAQTLRKNRPASSFTPMVQARTDPALARPAWGARELGAAWTLQPC